MTARDPRSDKLTYMSVHAVLLVLACVGATWVVGDGGGVDFAGIPMAAEV